MESHKVGKTISALIGVMLIAGCCRYTYCDCIPGNVIYLHYQNDSLGCPQDFQSLVTVTGYDNNNNALQETFYYYYGQCDMNITYRPNIYWVISSDSLHIADTLRVNHIMMVNNDEGCCDCGPQIRSIELDINGQLYSGNNVVRNF